MATKQYTAIWVLPETKETFLRKVAEQRVKGEKLTHDECLQMLMKK